MALHGAVAAAKKLAQDLGGAATEEAAEGIGAFFDKRKAAWVV